MKLRHIRKLGRFRRLASKTQVVNIYKGERVNGIGDAYFYLFRQKRQLVEERHIYGSEKQWEKLP